MLLDLFKISEQDKMIQHEFIKIKNAIHKNIGIDPKDLRVSVDRDDIIIIKEYMPGDDMWVDIFMTKHINGEFQIVYNKIPGATWQKDTMMILTKDLTLYYNNHNMRLHDIIKITTAINNGLTLALRHISKTKNIHPERLYATINAWNSIIIYIDGDTYVTLNLVGDIFKIYAKAIQVPADKYCLDIVAAILNNKIAPLLLLEHCFFYEN